MHQYGKKTEIAALLLVEISDDEFQHNCTTVNEIHKKIHLRPLVNLVLLRRSTLAIQKLMKMFKMFHAIQTESPFTALHTLVFTVVRQNSKLNLSKRFSSVPHEI
jgi:hypothetical protein